VLHTNMFPPYHTAADSILGKVGPPMRLAYILPYLRIMSVGRAPHSALKAYFSYYLTLPKQL